MLAGISLYWLTATAAPSARFHHHARGGSSSRAGCRSAWRFAQDVTQSMRAPAERLYDIRHWSEFERGGHSAAMEVPELLAEDVRRFFLTHIKHHQQVATR